jgi:hypothetical protein
MKFRYIDTGKITVNLIDSKCGLDTFHFTITSEEDYFRTNHLCLPTKTVNLRRNEGEVPKISKNSVVTLVLNMLPKEDNLHYYVDNVISRNVINKISHTPKQIGLDGAFLEIEIISIREMKVSPILPQIRYLFMNYDGENFSDIYENSFHSK